MMWVLAGVWFKGLPIKSIDHVVASLVAEPTEDDPDFSPPMLNKKIARLVRHVPPLGLFVYGAMLSFPLMPPPVELTGVNDGLKKTWATCRCCHGNRDLRCGVIGDKLIQRLQTLIQEREWQENLKVFRCSHVGGHKVMTADFAVSSPSSGKHRL